MKIGLIDVDGHNWPSLPLMKISAYHKAHGDEVEPWFPMNQYDKVYMSKVFSGSPDIDTVIYADEIERGARGIFTRTEGHTCRRKSSTYTRTTTFTLTSRRKRRLDFSLAGARGIADFA